MTDLDKDAELERLRKENQSLRSFLTSLIDMTFTMERLVYQTKRLWFWQRWQAAYSAVFDVISFLSETEIIWQKWREQP